jgi:phage gp16-like protein
MAAAARGRTNAPHYSIRMIWGIAKSPELSLDDEALYSVIERETQKDSMRKLTQGEIDRVCRVLQQMKDSVSKPAQRKRTDEGGNVKTERQRKKIYELTKTLGWNDDNQRINGFAKKMFKVERLEWLTPSQCYKLIEALKKMVVRQEDNS